MTRTARLLLQVVKDLAVSPLPDEIEIRRIHSWPWQRGLGAWSWVAGRPGGIDLFGSAVSAGAVIKAHKQGKVTAKKMAGCLELFID